MTDVERLDPTLLTERQRHEVPKLDDLLLREVRTHSLDQGLVDTPGIPHQMTRIQQSGLLAVVKPLRTFELEELVVVLFRGRLLSSRERPLRPSVVALDRL